MVPLEEIAKENLGRINEEISKKMIRNKKFLKKSLSKSC